MWWQESNQIKSNRIKSNRVELDYSNIHGEISAGCSLLASSTTKPTISSDRKIAAHVGLSFESHHLARFVYIRHTAAYGSVCVWVHYSTNFSFQEAQCSKLCTVLYDVRRLLCCSPPHETISKRKNHCCHMDGIPNRTVRVLYSAASVCIPYDIHPGVVSTSTCHHTIITVPYHGCHVMPFYKQMQMHSCNHSCSPWIRIRIRIEELLHYSRGPHQHVLGTFLESNEWIHVTYSYALPAIRRPIHATNAEWVEQWNSTIRFYLPAKILWLGLRKKNQS